MQFTSIFALSAAAALASAAPTAPTGYGEEVKQFAITSFSLGCTGSCYYALDVAIEGVGPNHPAVDTSVHCHGGLDENTDYTKCGYVSDTQSIYAFVVKETNELRLRYDVSVPAQGAYYSYYGETEVYSATGPQAELQKPDFKVVENRSTGIA